MENTFTLLSDSEEEPVPVAGAGYDVWEDTVAHLGALVSPASRQIGLGSQSVAIAQKHAIDAGLIPQWRVHVENFASIRTALRAGFEYAGTQTTVILKN
ncbi:GNAT family N-acetyltransferase [Glutamicibacter sp. JC586]|uniref:GNAT family N-acetyltransferase n=1 Tax=Glutamicibacter sp. JC586 TaxID=2590552 RepID=UPI001F44FCB5|nr:GNAT family protein [Glutamicibacter sp. JC586]